MRPSVSTARKESDADAEPLSPPSSLSLSLVLSRQDNRQDKTRQDCTSKHTSRTISLCATIHAWLDSKPRGDRSDIVHRHLHAAMALDASESEQLRMRRTALIAERERIDAQLQFIDTKLADFDEDIIREVAWRDEIAIYLRSRPPEEGQRFWANARGVPWPVYERLRASLPEAQRG